MATTSTPPARSSTNMATNTTTDDFDSLLTLEDQFYTEGYNQGMADGLAAGRAEGRQLGLERGFQKFVESGRLQGRAIVWANRLRMGGQARGQAGDQGVDSAASSSSFTTGSANPLAGQAAVGVKVDEAGEGGSGKEEKRLPPLPDNPRLAKHITTLYALVETESLSTENTDEGVDDFDDRLRRAQGRFKVIERMVGEGENGRQKGGEAHGHDPGAASAKGEEVDV